MDGYDNIKQYFMVKVNYKDCGNKTGCKEGNIFFFVQFIFVYWGKKNRNKQESSLKYSEPVNVNAPTSSHRYDWFFFVISNSSNLLMLSTINIKVSDTNYIQLC